jgi:hypothetical protein
MSDKRGLSIAVLTFVIWFLFAGCPGPGGGVSPNPGGGAPPSGPGQVDTGAGNAGILQFIGAAYSQSENGGSVVFILSRTGGSDGPVSVSYATRDLTATAGSDYFQQSGSMSWGDADAGNKIFSVTLIDDGTYEGDETFEVALGNPTGGATLGSNHMATVTIVENDPKGVVDQKQLLTDTSLESGIGGTSQQKLAQVITAGISGHVVAVRMPINWTNSGSLLIEMQGVTSNMPDGTVLASESFAGANFPVEESDGFRTFVFSAPVTPMSGDKFAVVLSAIAGQGGILCGPQGNPYLGGDGFFDARPNHPGWVQNFSRVDLPFETIVLVQ